MERVLLLLRVKLPGCWSLASVAAAAGGSEHGVMGRAHLDGTDASHAFPLFNAPSPPLQQQKQQLHLL